MTAHNLLQSEPSRRETVKRRILHQLFHVSRPVTVLSVALLAATAVLGSTINTISYLDSISASLPVAAGHRTIQHPSHTQNLALLGFPVSGQVLGDSITAPRSTTDVNSTIASLVDSQLKQYLTEGLLTGPQGPQGPAGSTIVQNGDGQTTTVIQNNPVVTYVPSQQSDGFTGGSIAGVTNLSSVNLTTQTENIQGALTVSGSTTVTGSESVSGSLSAGASTITSLTVSGPVNLTGSTTIAGLNVTGFNPGLTQGSIAFQGATALSQDNANFFYNSTTHSLGLGTSSPSSTLFIQGVGPINPFNVASSTGTSLLTVLADGDVGIGTSSPAFALDTPGIIDTYDQYDLQGQTFLTASSSLQNLYLGLSAGNSTATGTANTVIGYQAGQSLTSPSSSPQGDVFIGYQAGQDCTSCRETIAIGYQAGQAYTGTGNGAEDGLNTFLGSYTGKEELGLDNTYLGQKAGVSMASSTDQNNVFIGSHAGLGWTSGEFNVFLNRVNDYTDTATSTASGNSNIAIGYHSLNSAGNQNDNILIGTYSGAAEASISGNTLVGYGSGEYDATGAGDTFVGYGTGSNNVLGTALSNDTFLGYQAGYNASSTNDVLIGTGAAPNDVAGYQTIVGTNAGNNISTGTENTLIGYEAGQQLTGGAENIALGFLAGASNLTNATNTIIIGNNISLPAATTSNELDIGNLLYATGIGSGGVGAGSGDVGIGSSTPGFMLTVVGTNSNGMFLSNPNGNDQLQVDSNVNSQAVLAFSGAGTVKSRILAQSSGSNTGLIIQNGQGNSHTGLQVGNNDVGINLPNFPTTYPANALDVEGGVAIGSPYAGTTTAPSNGLIVAGNVGVGSSSPIATLAIQGSGSTNPLVVASSTGTQLLTVSTAGGLTASDYPNCSGFTTNSSGLIQCTASDQRLKQEVTPLGNESGLAAINALNPVSFFWLDPTRGTTEQFGFIAQQVQQVFPNLVSTTTPTALTPGGTLTLNYDGLISPLILATQELSASSTAMQSAISTLQNQVSSLQNSFGGNARSSNLSVYSPSNFSGDSVGEAEIPAGQTSVRVSFSQQYAYQPIVTAFPEGAFTPGFIAEKDNAGFALAIPQATTTAVTFDWHSFASPNEQLTVTGGTPQAITLVVAPFAPAGDQKLTVSANSDSSSTTTPTDSDSSATDTPGGLGTSTPPSIMPTPTTPTPTQTPAAFSTPAAPPVPSPTTAPTATPADTGTPMDQGSGS